MPKPSAHIAALPGSGIREIMNLALTMSDAVHVEVGEPNFLTPHHIVEAANRAAREGYTRYTANAGLPSLRQAIADKLLRVNGLAVHPDRITVTHGAVSGLMVALAAVVEPGDEVLIPDPGWPNYLMMLGTLRATPVRYGLNPAEGFQPDLDILERAVSPRTKALLVNSPGNPTGAVFSPDVVASLVEFARRHDLWLISDDVYEELVFEGVHTCPLKFDTDGRVIPVFSFSKTYAMTGWRVGYMVTPPTITSTANKLQEAFVACASSVSQKAAEAALLGPQSCVEEMRQAYKVRRDLVVGIQKENNLFSYAPQGAFYAMVPISQATNDTYAFAKKLLLEHRVAVAPGETFGPAGKGFVRISLAASESSLRDALGRIATAVASALAHRSL